MSTLIAKHAEAQVEFRPASFSGYQTGVLDISLESRRILSIPTQLGCRVGCTFCVSSLAPLIRNLSADEMLSMIRSCLEAAPSDGRPLELSFTGEGEAVLNWRATAEVCRVLPSISSDFQTVRYCFSGIGSDTLLEKLDAGEYPMRLQFSLHAARQATRDALVPRSLPLPSTLAAIRKASHRFSAIELNVVLQDGVNDSDEDLVALANWGDSAWPIILNPLLGDGQETVAKRTELFATMLTSRGRTVLRYSTIGTRISRRKIYPLMTARRTNSSTGESIKLALTPEK